MSEPTRNPIEELFEKYLDQRRRGLSPSIAAFAQNYPVDLAEEIRNLFPAMEMLEEMYQPPSVDAKNLDLDRHQPAFFGDYELLRELGRGGMGVVYHARHRSLGKEVAVKVLPGSLSSEKYRHRFLREARSAARLHHGNIVGVFDFGEQDERYFYVMQYIRGTNLADVIHQDRIAKSDEPAHIENVVPSVRISRAKQNSDSSTSQTFVETNPNSQSDSTKSGISSIHHSDPLRKNRWYDVARIGLQVAEGLAYAHSQSVLHRDIKPANLMLDERGNTWITDFGLAKSGDDDDLTHTGDIVGTLRYLPPESLSGKADARGDVCSLGLTLYELASLRPAYQNEDRRALLRSITDSNPVSLGSVCESIPRDLETIIHKAIEREPGDRYSSAQHLADDLRRFLNHEPIRARRTSWLGLATRWSKRNPWLAAATTAMLLGLTVTAIGSTIAAFRFSKLSTDLGNALRTSKQSEQAAQDAELESRRRLFDASVTAARWSVGSKKPGQRNDSLAAIRTAEPLIEELGLGDKERLELRNLAIEALSRPDVQPAWETEDRHAGHGWAVAFPESDLYIRSETWPAKTLELRKISDKSLLTETAAGYIDRFQFDPTTRLLFVTYLTSRDAKVVVSRLRADGDLEFLTERALAPRGAHCSDYATNADIWAYVADEHAIGIVSKDSGKEIKRLEFSHKISRVRLSPDGRKAIVWHGAATVVDIDSGTVTKLPFPIRFHCDFDDKARILAADYENVTTIWNLETNSKIATFTATSTSDHVDVHPDGQFIATQHWDRHIRIWDSSGELQLTIPGIFPRFSLDGNFLSYFRNDKLGYLKFDQPKTHKARAFYTEKHISLTFSRHGFWAEASGNLSFLDSQLRNRIDSVRGANTNALLKLPDGSAIISTAAAGIVEWPIRRVEHKCIIGPPKHTGLNFPSVGDLVCDASGETLAVGGQYQAAILRRQPDGWDARSVKRYYARHIALSGDGKRLVVGHGGKSVIDTKTLETLAEFNVDDRAMFDASSQRLLLMSSRSPTIVDTDDWSQNPWTFPLSGHPRALSRSRNTAALSKLNPHQVCLFDFNLNKELASFPSTNVPGVPDRTDCLDEKVSVLVSWLPRRQNSMRLAIWDLREVRNSLREMNLDWDAPPITESVLDFKDAATEFEVLKYPPEHDHLQLDEETGRIVMEAPFLVSAARASSNEPWVHHCILDVAPRGLRRFSGETRLIWKPTANEKRLTFDVEVPAEGTYSLKLSMGRSPRRGICRLYVNDEQIGEDSDRYTNLADQLLLPPEKLGQAEFKAGMNSITFEIVGKNENAQDDYLGIDYLKLIPVAE